MKMKSLALAILTVLAMSHGAKAQTMTNASPVKLVVPYQTTCSSVTLLSATPVELTGNTSVVTTSAGMSWVKVTNLDATATVFCSHSASVSASGSNIGDPVCSTTVNPHNNRQDWRISTSQKWYCVSTVNGSNIIKCLLK